MMIGSLLQVRRRLERALESLVTARGDLDRETGGLQVHARERGDVGLVLDHENPLLSRSLVHARRC
jgi:hypothetical protein